MRYLSILILSLFLSACVETEQVRRLPEAEYVDTARVLYADPIYETVRIMKPVKKCQYECEYVDSYEEEKRITGYRVAYKYQGRTLFTHTDQKPGDSITVTVTINPLR